jgi:hypothetical protein
MKFLLCTLALMTTLFSANRTLAQQPPRFEAGPVLSCISDCKDHPAWGWGGQATVNVTPNLAGEAQVFGRNQHFYSADIVTTFNAKVSLRLERQYKFNLFGIVGPGFLSAEVDRGKITYTRNRESLALFNFGVGGEFVPVRNFALRVDVTHLTFADPCEGDVYCSVSSFFNGLHGNTAKLGFLFRSP